MSNQRFRTISGTDGIFKVDDERTSVTTSVSRKTVQEKIDRYGAIRCSLKE